MVDASCQAAGFGWKFCGAGGVECGMFSRARPFRQAATMITVDTATPAQWRTAPARW
jgi:hypothetical protein